MTALPRIGAPATRALAAQRGVEIVVEAPDEPCLAEADVRRVERVVRNLVTNAIDHARRPGDDRSGPVRVVIRVAGGSMFAVTPSYICERFPASVRGTGFGLGYSLPLLVTSGYASYQDGLTALVPMAYTPVVLLVIGGALILGGALLGPETRDIDLHDPGLGTAERKRSTV